MAKAPRADILENLREGRMLHVWGASALHAGSLLLTACLADILLLGAVNIALSFRMGLQP